MISSCIADPNSLVTAKIEPTCDVCNRVFKDSRGLSIHKSRCRSTYNTICSYCGHIASTIYRLEDHYTTCMSFKIHQVEQKYQKQIQDIHNEYSIKIDQIVSGIREEYDQRVSCLREEYEYKIKESNITPLYIQSQVDLYKQLEETKIEQDHKIKQLEQTVSRLEKNNHLLTINLIEFARKSSNLPMTTSAEREGIKVTTHL